MHIHAALLVIDVQNGFIHTHTSHLPAKITSLLRTSLFPFVCFSRFINTPNSPFITQLSWNKCMSGEETEIVPELKPFAQQIFIKHGINALTEELDTFLHLHDLHTLVIVGLETDACILKTAMDAFEKGYTVFVLSDHCATKLGPKRHEDALSILGKNIGYHRVMTLNDFISQEG